MKIRINKIIYRVILYKNRMKVKNMIKNNRKIK